MFGMFAADTTWDVWAQAWGPAVPMFGAFMWVIVRFVNKTIPRAVKDVREQMERHELRADQRHEELVGAIEYLTHKLEGTLPNGRHKKHRDPPGP